ncbi:MAG: plastocyanin/azurin family copper-binding protein [Thaumarchaeota archaeon]|nr:plastocyanin/azurin family copper-binding protein [Nitrososphaerota archaeon]
MAAIDKAAIGFSIAIVAIGVAFAMAGETTQSSTLAPVAPVERPAPVMEPEPEVMEPEPEVMDKDKETTMEDKMALTIQFGAGAETIEILISPSYELSDEETECPENKLGISGYCVPYYIKGGMVTDASVNMEDNSVVIAIDAADDGKLILIKSKEGIEVVDLILVDGEETDDYSVMEKSEMMKDKERDAMKEKDGDSEYGDGMAKEDKDAEPAEKEDTMAGPQTVTVDMPEGTALPGCEVDDACFVPADVVINVGDTVSWINSDTAAHTITSGSATDGPTGIFDSSLVMVGAGFEYTFEEAGTIEYFCMVHPWMEGTVTVN